MRRRVSFLLVGGAAAVVVVLAVYGLPSGRVDPAPISGCADDRYATSESCGECHHDQHASWHASFHRTMTRRRLPRALLEAHHGAVVVVAEGRFALERRGEELWVSAAGENPRPIDLFTGSHHMLVYWVAESNGQRRALPFTYLLAERRWAPRASVFVRDPNQAFDTQVWNTTCSACHAVAPQPGWEPPHEGMNTCAVELGIACEACHGPGAAHVGARRADPDDTRAPMVHPERIDPVRSAQLCGQCHGITCEDGWPMTPSRYSPGEDLERTKPLLTRSGWRDSPCYSDMPDPNVFLDASFWADGMVRVSGREYNGVAASPCFAGGELSCMRCHAMHRGEPEDQLDPETPGDEACLQCHEDFRAAPSDHTHHPPDSAGSRCYNCHMPHTTWGLLKAMRSHQIDSPRVSTDLATGRANACNLCHLDRTLRWSAEHLARWYDQPAPAADLEAKAPLLVSHLLSGDAGQRALAAWTMAWEPALEASGRDWPPRLLTELLDDPYPAVRFVAHRGAGRAPAGYDAFAPTDPEAMAALRATMDEPLHIGEYGALSREEIDALRAAREERSVLLAE